MTLNQILVLAYLLSIECSSNAYSHRKRDLLLEVIADLLKRALTLQNPPINDVSEIPF